MHVPRTLPVMLIREEVTSRRILHYNVALALTSLLPFLIGMSGWLYLVAAVVLGTRFIVLAWRLRGDARLAMPTFRYPIIYLVALFAILLMDHYA